MTEDDVVTIIIFSAIALLIVFFVIRYFVWAVPRDKISSLSYTLDNERKKNKELHEINETLKLTIEKKAQEYKTSLFNIKEIYHESLQSISNEVKNDEIKNAIKTIINCSIREFNQLRASKSFLEESFSKRNTYINIVLAEELELLKEKISLLESKSNLTVIPYMAQIIADFETYEIERVIQSLNWGYSYERHQRMNKIREIRKAAIEMVEKNKESQYQLSYLLKLFPELEDIIECEFKSLPHISINLVEDRDVARDYLSKEEYAALSTTERNQLALNRYLNSHNKSKWQIGRDYEQFVGYKYTLDGYIVDNFGTYKGLEDLGRDVIAKKGNKTLIIQCKYWSSLKLIHEKHVTQLYGTVMSYCIENDISDKYVTGVLVTNITLSDTAKEFAKRLHIEYIEELEMGDYPCIKCNLGATGEKIYHLPFDQQYDATKIEPHKGEFYALTVKEAEDAGFRRAHKYFGS